MSRGASAWGGSDGAAAPYPGERRLTGIRSNDTCISVYTGAVST